MKPVPDIQQVLSQHIQAHRKAKEAATKCVEATEAGDKKSANRWRKEALRWTKVCVEIEKRYKLKHPTLDRG